MEAHKLERRLKAFGALGRRRRLWRRLGASVRVASMCRDGVTKLWIDRRPDEQQTKNAPGFLLESLLVWLVTKLFQGFLYLTQGQPERKGNGLCWLAESAAPSFHKNE